MAREKRLFKSLWMFLLTPSITLDYCNQDLDELVHLSLADYSSCYIVAPSSYRSSLCYIGSNRYKYLNLFYCYLLCFWVQPLNLVRRNLQVKRIFCDIKQWTQFISETQDCHNRSERKSTNDCKGSKRSLPYQITTCFLFSIENPDKDKQPTLESSVEVQIERRLV